MNERSGSVEPDDATLEERLERVTDFLTERGYLARWNWRRLTMAAAWAVKGTCCTSTTAPIQMFPPSMPNSV